MRTTVALLLTLTLAILSPCLDAREDPSKPRLRILTDGFLRHASDLKLRERTLFGLASAGTTWLGADPTGTSVVVGGVWDFDNRGTIVCTTDPNDSAVYLKNGAFAQGWTSEDGFAQKGIYFHAEDFSDPGFACSRGPVAGGYSAWCGQVSRTYENCFADPPGYGTSWDQWLCRTVTLGPSDNSLSYTFRSNTGPNYDFVYVIIDTMVTSRECGYLVDGWPATEPDTLRCYTGDLTPTADLTDTVDLSDPKGWYDGVHEAPGFYDGKTVRISFVVVSDTASDDEDGGYTTCDGAFAVDDIVVSTAGGPDTTEFESGTLEEWEAAPGGSPGGGDFAAVRDVSYFTNRDECGFDNCEMQGCTLCMFDPDIPGAYGAGGHHLGWLENIAWTPTIDLTAIPDGWGFLANYDVYADLPNLEWIFYVQLVKYFADTDCPTGAWSPNLTGGYAGFANYPKCSNVTWDFSGLVPNDADSLKFGFVVAQACNVWAVPCYSGNETPFFDNVRIGIYGDGSAPRAGLLEAENFIDAFPEDGTCDSTSTARIDTNDLLGRGLLKYLIHGDSLVTTVAGDDVKVELCFKVIPGPGTDLTDPFFTTRFPGTYVPCDTSSGVNLFQSARMDTAFLAGNGVSPVFQFVRHGSYATMFHEEDPRSGGVEGVEILPDSLFTAGTRIYYYVRTSYLGSDQYGTVPYGATEDDLATLFEVEVLPDLCKDPPACLLYYDYFNRGAQGPIEKAFTELGRTWDRYDVRDEDSRNGNGIGNRFLADGAYALRGFTGPSLEQLGHYNVILISKGTLGAGYGFTDGLQSGGGAPTNDIAAMQAYITEGPPRGLWLSGNSIADGLNDSEGSPMRTLLNDVMGAILVSGDYQANSGHNLTEQCRDLHPHFGDAAADNYFSVADSLGLYGSGCPTQYNYDVIRKNTAADDIVGDALLYDRCDIPGECLNGPAYASVYHIFPTGQGSDSARTVIDGFSLHLLKDERCWTGKGIKDWMRDLLGNPGPSGVEAPGFFALRPSGELLCPPVGDELVGADGPPPARYSYKLSQNYPNPFRARTTIRFSTKKKERVEILVFDAAGRLVKRLNKVAGPGEAGIVWDGTEGNGRPVASGVYFYQIRAGDFVSGKRMILVK